MFARHVSFRLKPNVLSEYSLALRNEIVPLLRKQKGFKDEIVLSNPDSLDFVGITLWERQADAEAYNENVYPSVVEIVQGMLDGTPTVETFVVVTSQLLSVAQVA